MQRLLVFAAICVALIQAHGSLNPCPEDIQTCLDAGASCEDLSATYDYFCAPGSAATNSFILGCVCAPLPTIGQPCNATCTDVKYEPICHDDGTGGVCRWVGIFGPGETCVSGDSNFVNGGCIAGTTCQSGKCSGTQTLAASGKACTSDTDCKFGLACLYDNKGTKVCGKPWSSPVGNGCDSSEQCEPGAFCNTDGGANVCALLTGINVDCTGNTFGCYGVTYPEEPLTCSCAYEEGSTPANFTTTGVGTCRPSLTWVPNKATRDAWNSFQSCLSDNKCARGTGFGPGSCMDQHCATQYAALQLSMNKVGKRTCAQLAQLPFLLGGDTSAAASTYIASALLAVLAVLAAALAM